MTLIPEPREIRRLPRAPFTRWSMSRGETIAAEERFADAARTPAPTVEPEGIEALANVGTLMVDLIPDIAGMVRGLQLFANAILIGALRRSLTADEFHSRMLRGARGKAIRLERKHANIRIRRKRRLLRELAQPSNGGPR